MRSVNFIAIERSLSNCTTLGSLKRLFNDTRYDVFVPQMDLGINRFHLLALISWQCMNFFGGSNLFSIFSNFMPDWSCGGGPIGKNCSIYKECTRSQQTITFTHITFHSNAYEFEWFCDGSYYASYSNQIQFFGYFFGTLLFGFASDIFGRKLITTLAVALGIAATLFFILYGLYSLLASALVSLLEMLLPEQRMFARAYFNWGISRMLLTTICYLTQEWRKACFGIAICCMPALLALMFIFPESPTWLLSKGRLVEMRESEKKIARIAGVRYVPVDHPIPKKPKSIIAVMKSGLWRRLVVLWAMWFTAATSAYATDLASNRLSGNLYLNQFLFGLVLYVSKVILGLVDARFPSFTRRMLHQGSQFGAVVCFGALAVFKLTGYHGHLMLVLNIIGIVFVEYTWDANYLCAIEGVETASRASATGSSSFIARIGMLLSPMLGHIDIAHPGTIYTIVTMKLQGALFAVFISLIHADDDTAFIKTVLTGMCRRIASVKRADIVIGTGLEKGSSESVAIPILASMTHVLFDLYDESKQSGESLNKFVAKCDHTVALAISSSQFSVVKKTEQDAHYDKYINQLQKTQKLKHGEVSKIASELTENFGASLQLKDDEMRVNTERMLHMMLIRYELAKGEKISDDSLCNAKIYASSFSNRKRIEICLPRFYLFDTCIQLIFPDNSDNLAKYSLSTICCNCISGVTVLRDFESALKDIVCK
ncbi:hypothetical protein PRIPAC_80731 [Pristionchus pacificus]|uniref:Uncharacterized protein n=1 Tax=Pristionchus pacificus TaxID=54126 RepID=A0A2A6C4F9_PRIPA|nr:hypothetical protein PRIPAC_80731 [Pristionchus pacificus]|eukprot:PDM73006.1 hypothetical protein PRIPAC_39440 [Pristionchus pacificus]